MRIALSLLLLAALLSLGGCASIVSKSRWQVAVAPVPAGSTPVVTVKDANNGAVIQTSRAPFVVTLPSKGGYFKPAQYSFTVEGGETVYVKSALNGWYFGNLLFGGLVGFFVVDPLTGAMWRLPESVGVGGDAGGRPADGFYQ